MLILQHRNAESNESENSVEHHWLSCRQPNLHLDKPPDRLQLGARPGSEPEREPGDRAGKGQEGAMERGREEGKHGDTRGDMLGGR